MKVGIIYIYDFIDQGAISARGIREQVDQFDAQGVELIELHINSSGGDVFEGIAIYNFLKTKNVIVYVDGIAASTASLIAMAGKEIIMYSSSMMMIHNPWILSAGDGNQMRRQGQTLDQVKEAMIEAYMERTGLKKNEISDLMDAESFMSAKEAVKKGFADKVEKIKDFSKSKNYIGMYVALFDDENEKQKTGDSIMNKALLKFLGYTEEEITAGVKEEAINTKLKDLRAKYKLAEDADITDVIAAVSAEKKADPPAPSAEPPKAESSEEKIDKFLADQKKKEVENLVNGAVEAGKILPAEKNAYMAYADKDFDGCKKELDAKAKNSAVPGKVTLPAGEIKDTPKPKTLDELKAEAASAFKTARKT